MTSRFLDALILLTLALMLMLLTHLYAETCPLVANTLSGDSRICEYACPSGRMTLTVKATASCPSSLAK